MTYTTLITGASSGIGLELARCFARHGHRCVLVARREDKLRELVGRLRDDHNIDAHAIVQDLADPQGPQRLYDEVKRRELEVDVLINNAGFGNGGRFDRNPVQSELDLLQVNVVSLAHLCRLFLSDFVRRRGGKILNVASVAGFMPGPLMANYYASKAYVISLSRALHREYVRHGITVSVLCPGPTRTEFFDRAEMHNAELSRGRVLAMQDAPYVAEVGYRGLMKGKPMMLPGLRNKLMATAGRVMPMGLTAWTVKRLNRNKPH